MYACMFVCMTSPLRKDVGNAELSYPDTYSKRLRDSHISLVTGSESVACVKDLMSSMKEMVSSFQSFSTFSVRSRPFHFEL